MNLVQPTALLGAPAGRAFLRIAMASGFPVRVIVRPVVSVHLAARAVEEISRWNSNRPRVMAALAQPMDGLSELAAAVLHSTQTAWWFGPLDRMQQIWFGRDDIAPEPSRLHVPSGPPSSWERYAQKPIGGLFTSTLIEGTSAIHAVLAQGVGDMYAAHGVGTRAIWHLRAHAQARVFEVDGPSTWHVLCTRYPALAEDGRLTPDWSRVAQDWDAVHVTLSGVLLAEQVRVESANGWTQFDGWDFEQTVWLRWQFERVAALPPISTPRPDLPRLRIPEWY